MSEKLVLKDYHFKCINQTNYELQIRIFLSSKITNTMLLLADKIGVPTKTLNHFSINQVKEPGKQGALLHNLRTGIKKAFKIVQDEIEKDGVVIILNNSLDANTSFEKEGNEWFINAIYCGLYSHKVC